MDAFSAEEIGDQQDLTEALQANGEIEQNGAGDDPVPAFGAD